MTPLEIQGAAARAAEQKLSQAGETLKNAALEAIAAALEENQDQILNANGQDMARARLDGMRQSFLDRLELNPARIAALARGVREVAALPDPVGRFTDMTTRPNGLVIGRKTVPLGVVGIIYEARPNVTVDAAVLCLKAGSAVILRGGREAHETNLCLAGLMRAALTRAGLPEACVDLVADTDRQSAQALMNLTAYLDVLIPRGGAGLIRSVVENARVPVIATGAGVCHTYVDETADYAMAAEIVYNAKVSRPSVCNALETLLVDQRAAADFLPLVKAALDRKPVELRGDAQTRAILGPGVLEASDADWDTEYGDYILSVRVVDGLDEALRHIAAHSTGHSECICTGDYFRAQRFLNEVDAAAVYVNASTRFTDGGEFGLGAEIGISTQKLHARGPMGLNQLVSSKYIVYGTGQIRA